MCLDVVRNPAWSSLVMKRLAAKAMQLMSETSVIGHARQLTATRCKCFSCATPLALITPSLVRSEQRASRSLRQSANVSRNWAIAKGVSSQKFCLEPKRATTNKRSTTFVRECQEQHKGPGPGMCADGSSGQKKTSEQTRFDVQKNTHNWAQKLCGSLMCGNIAPVTRSTLWHDDPPCHTPGFLPHFLGANTCDCFSVFGQGLLNGHQPRSSPPEVHS